MKNHRKDGEILDVGVWIQQVKLCMFVCNWERWHAFRSHLALQRRAF